MSNRILVTDPESLAKKLMEHLGVVCGTPLQNPYAAAIHGLRELAVLRVRDKALEPYLRHLAGCPHRPAVSFGENEIQPENTACTCGLSELQASEVMTVMDSYPKTGVLLSGMIG